MARSWKQEALIVAPVPEVWALLEDPEKFPKWNPEAIRVTGLPTQIEKGSRFRLTGRGPLGLKTTTTFAVEELDELREIKLRCQTTGYYSRWRLTEAQGHTFAEVEFGIEPAGIPGQAAQLVHTKSYLRRVAQQAVDGVRRAVRPAEQRK